MMTNFTTNWFDITGKSNFEYYLSRYKGLENLYFLEIGCWEGQATVWLLENILTHSTDKIMCIDTFEGSFEHKNSNNLKLDTLEERFLNNITIYKAKVVVKKGFSQQVLREIKECFDFVYIDGSHMAADVLEDAILAFRLLKPDGIMIFDDYKWKIAEDPFLNPALGIDSFLSVFGNKIEVLKKEYQVVILKK